VPATLPTRVFDPCRGRRVIEKRAWSCLQRCRKLLSLEEIPLPVPIEQWIEWPLQYRFGFTDLSYLGDDVLGATFVKEREILIDEQAVYHDGRCRFTCAHELAHMILHGRLRPEFRETPELGPGSDNFLERQADRFAAAFLVPLPLLEDEILRVFEDCRADKVKCTWELMQPSVESEWMWRTLLLPMITRRFGVSLSTAINRCSDIEPRIPKASPLLPLEFTRTLLHRSERQQQLETVQLVDGVPQKRDLFTATEAPTTKD